MPNVVHTTFTRDKFFNRSFQDERTSELLFFFFFFFFIRCTRNANVYNGGRIRSKKKLELYYAERWWFIFVCFSYMEAIAFVDCIVNIIEVTCMWNCERHLQMLNMSHIKRYTILVYTHCTLIIISGAQTLHSIDKRIGLSSLIKCLDLDSRAVGVWIKYQHRLLVETPSNDWMIEIGCRRRRLNAVIWLTTVALYRCQLAESIFNGYLSSVECSQHFL